MLRKRTIRIKESYVYFKYSGKEDDPRSNLGLIKAMFGVFVRKISLGQFIFGNANVETYSSKREISITELERDGPMSLPRENLEDQLRRDVKATLSRNASEAEAKRLEAGKPADSGELGTPDERTRARQKLAKEIERLQALGYTVELDENNDTDEDASGDDPDGSSS